MDREVGSQLDLAAAPELHVDRLVLTVGAEESDQHRQPAAEPDLGLLEDLGASKTISDLPTR